MVKSVITWESAFDGLTYGNKVSTLVTTTDHVTTSSNDLDYESACRFRSGAVYDPPTSYLGGVWQVWQGYGNFLWGAAKGIAAIPYAVYHGVVHPVDSATTVWNVATSPGQVIHAIWSDFYNKAGSLKGQREIAGEAITTVFTVGAGQAVSGASKAKMIANAAKTLDKAADVGDTAADLNRAGKAFGRLGGCFVPGTQVRVSEVPVRLAETGFNFDEQAIDSPAAPAGIFFEGFGNVCDVGDRFRLQTAQRHR